MTDEEKREAVEFLRSGECLYWVERRKNAARLLALHEGERDAFRSLRRALRIGQLRHRRVEEARRPYRLPERESRASSVSWSPALDKVLPLRSSLRGYANGV